MKKATQNIIAAIEKMHLGQESSLSKTQCQMVWEECDELLTGKEARVGMGSTIKNIFEYKTASGKYFEFHYYDSGRMQIVRGSHL